jgi:tripartite-type tricarboxylate transporter receptor subunit TctC
MARLETGRLEFIDRTMARTRCRINDSAGRLARVAGAVTVLAGVAVALGVAAPAAQAADPAQGYPSQPIRIIVPYAPGGLPDITARLIAGDLGTRLGQSVIVENRPGANGSIGTGMLARAKPDGYTLGVVASSHVFGRALMPSLPYDPLKDFAPITMAVTTPVVLTESATLPPRTLAEFVDYARARPGALSFASAGIGSNTHVFGQWFSDMAKINMVHVPYKGAAPAHVDLVSGRIALEFDTLAAAQPFIDNGKVRVLAVAGPARLAQYPDVPTVEESGYPGFQAELWDAVLAPAGTPAAIVEKLNHAIVAGLRSPELERKLALAGAQVVADSPDQVRATLASEERRYGELIRKMNITVE